MKKPELLVTPQSVAHIEQLIEAGADAFLVGEQQFGLRLAGEFTIDEIEKSVELAHASNKKVYVAMNALYHNDRVDLLRPYMEKLAAIGVDGITFGDPAVVMVKREANLDIPLHWNTEMTATNWFTANYWGKRGSNRAVLARELSMDEIDNRSGQKNMFLHDKERHNKYPIYEDANGTHIFSPNDMCLIEELGELIDAGIDSFKIDGVLQEATYVTKVTNLYRQAIDAYSESSAAYDEIKSDLLAEIEEMQPELRPLDTGFFFKETVY
jgi:putative protease